MVYSSHHYSDTNSKAPRSVSINPLLYGIGGPGGEYKGYTPRNIPARSEYQETQAFRDNNAKSIGVGKIGEWETVEDEVVDVVAVDEEQVMREAQSSIKDSNISLRELTKDAVEEAVEFEDEDEGVSKADVRSFMVTQKVLKKADQVAGSDSDEPVFKKKRKLPAKKQAL